jgi:DNA-binding SARP family transcriptional activator
VLVLSILQQVKEMEAFSLQTYPSDALEYQRIFPRVTKPARSRHGSSRLFAPTYKPYAREEDGMSDIVKEARAYTDILADLQSVAAEVLEMLGRATHEIERLRETHEADTAEIERLLAALKDMVHIATQIGNFRNGVEHNGIDEGEVIAGRYIDQACAAIAKAEGRKTG